MDIKLNYQHSLKDFEEKLTAEYRQQNSVDKLLMERRIKSLQEENSGYRRKLHEGPLTTRYSPLE